MHGVTRFRCCLEDDAVCWLEGLSKELCWSRNHETILPFTSFHFDLTPEGIRLRLILFLEIWPGTVLLCICWSSASKWRERIAASRLHSWRHVYQAVFGVYRRTLDLWCHFCSISKSSHRRTRRTFTLALSKRRWHGGLCRWRAGLAALRLRPQDLMWQ